MVSTGCCGRTGLSNDGWKMGFTVLRTRINGKYVPALESIRSSFANRDIISPLTPINKYRRLFFTSDRCRNDRHNCVYCAAFKSRGMEPVSIRTASLYPSIRRRDVRVNFPPETNGTLADLVTALEFGFFCIIDN